MHVPLSMVRDHFDESRAFFLIGPVRREIRGVIRRKGSIRVIRILHEIIKIHDALHVDPASELAI